MMEPKLQKELASFAEELAEVARKEILPFWRKPIKAESKIEPGRPRPESPVTIADRNAETAMRKLIEARYPSHGICGEEFGNVRVDAEFCWVLDPIDGTKSFITGKPLFGTLIGLCHHGKPVIGIIDQCVLKERWVGIVGSGTTLNGEPVHASGVADLGEAMMYSTTPLMFAAGFETERFNKIRDTVKRPLFGTDCYAYGLVASGFGADLVVEADLGLYDYAALVPVVCGAGGIMTNWEGGELNIKQHEASHGRVVAAANKSLHQAAVKLLCPPTNGHAATNGSAVTSVMKEHLRELPPYVPPLDGRDIKKHILLDFNERTVPVPDHIVSALKDHIDVQGLRMYPAYGNLAELMAEYYGVRKEQCLFTNGSDQGIDLVVRGCCKDGTEAIIPAPTFAMYEQACMTENLVIKRPWFTKEGGFPTDEVLSLVGPQTSLIVLSNPNNPTGTPIARADICRIAEKARHCAILVDECYFEFMPPESTVANEISRFTNLFVCRTFSKTWGFPALRIGALLSCDANIRALGSVRGPYDVNQLAAVAVRAALANKQYMLSYVDEINNKSLPRFIDYLRSEKIDFWPTSANYILCYFSGPAALEKRLRAKNILVRPKKDEKGVLALRITIGTLDQTEQLIRTLKELLQEDAEPAAKKSRI